MCTNKIFKKGTFLPRQSRRGQCIKTIKRYQAIGSDTGKQGQWSDLAFLHHWLCFAYCVNTLQRNGRRTGRAEKTASFPTAPVPLESNLSRGLWASCWLTLQVMLFGSWKCWGTWSWLCLFLGIITHLSIPSSLICWGPFGQWVSTLSLYSLITTHLIA